MGATFSRVKTWTSTEDVNASDLNEEFDNLLTNFTPAGMDDYSANVSQMQSTADPGEVGSESQATSLAGELQRLRHIISEITGEDEWYESPVSSLLGLANAIGSSANSNRLVSGRVRTTSSQPVFLVPNGAARTVKLDGTPTNFKYYVNGTEYTISSDVTLTNLTAAPSSNNTCLVNDSTAADQAWTKYTGENGSEIPVDTMGTEITALVGKFAGFKIAGTTDEYFLAYVKSATSLTKIRRGYFFDSSDNPIPRAGYTNNDVITLMKLSWIYAKTDGTLEVGYTNPTYGKDEPSSPATGDFWFDTDNQTWKKYSGTSFAASNSTLVGICLQDTSNTVAARSFEFFLGYSDTNNLELILESNTQVKTNLPGHVNVWGVQIRNDQGLYTWDMTLDLESGVTEGASTDYFFYLTEEGDKIISDIRPYDRRADLQGYYHPYHSWRCLGSAFNDGSSNLGTVNSYFKRGGEVNITEPKTAVSYIEVLPTIVRLNSSGGAFSKMLHPAALCRGQVLRFIKTNSELNAITIDGFSSETINGATTTNLITQYEYIEMFCDGTEWFIRHRHAPSSWTSDGVVSVGATTTPPTKATGVVVDRMLWKRDGNDLVGRIELAFNNTTSAAAGTGDYLFRVVPTGLTIDTSLITVYTTAEGAGTYVVRNSVGDFHAFAGAGTSQVVGEVVVYDTTQVRFMGISSTPGDGAVGSAFAAFAGTNNCSYSAHYRVPITEFKP